MSVYFTDAGISNAGVYDTCYMLYQILYVRSKQRDPNPGDGSLMRKEPSTYKGFHSAFAVLVKEFLLGLGSLCLLRA